MGASPASKQIGQLSNRGSAGAVSVRKTLSEFAAIGLALRFECDEVSKADAAVSSHAMRNDLAAIQELVQMRPTHPQTLGRLSGGERGIAVDHGKIGTITDAAAQAEQHITQLGASRVLSELRQRDELVLGNVRSLNGLHAGQPQ